MSLVAGMEEKRSTNSVKPTDTIHGHPDKDPEIKRTAVFSFHHIPQNLDSKPIHLRS
jgi:hypothetical protein